MSQKDAQNYLQEYSIKLGPGDDPNNPASEQRGVMVIKSKSKTKAKQRKGAVANWKVVYYSSSLHLNFFHLTLSRKSQHFPENAFILFSQTKILDLSFLSVIDKSYFITNF